MRCQGCRKLIWPWQDFRCGANLLHLECLFKTLAYYKRHYRPIICNDANLGLPYAEFEALIDKYWNKTVKEAFR